VTALPHGLRVSLDPSLRGGPAGALIGGSPRRLLRLSATGRRALQELHRGRAESPAARVLGRRMMDAGLLHPRARALEPSGKVTVVIPVRDRAAQLARCLNALGREASAIVVDDGSIDAAEVAALASLHNAELIRRSSAGGPAAARNTALPRLTTEFVAFLDSDCVPADGWLRALIGHFEDPLVGAVAPRVRPSSNGEGAVARYLASRSPLDMGAREADVRPGGRVPYVPSAALLVRCAALASDFDEQLRYGEDVDLVWRLHDAGWSIRYDPAVQVSHDGPRTLREAMARRMRYGTSASPLAARHPGRLAPLTLRPASALVTLALLGRRRSAAAGLAALEGVGLLTRLRRAGISRSTGARWSAQAMAEALLSVTRYAATVALPITLAAAWRSRSPRWLGLLALPALREWSLRDTALDPLRWTALALADDAAYAAGVWSSCIRGRNAAPLMPRLAGSGLRAAGEAEISRPRASRSADGVGLR
jgi:mycofactocin system glycosyltransferase